MRRRGDRRRRLGVVAVGLALCAQAVTACAQHTETAPAPAGSAAPVLLTDRDGGIDELTGRAIGPAELGIAPNGCVTLGGRYLRAGAGSAVAADRRTVALSDIGTYTIGSTVPTVYGYRRTFTAADLPAERARCGSGDYVDALRSTSIPRARALLVGSLDRGRTTTLNGLLIAAGNGCVRVGDAYLVAPEGSMLGDDGHTVVVPEAGPFFIGAGMPDLPARTISYSAADLPSEFRACGPGSYVSVTDATAGPVLTYDRRNDSARMVVRASSITEAPTATVRGGVLGRRSTCATVGDRFLVAPPGSTVFDGGRRVRLRGIGTFALGDVLPALPGRTTVHADGAVPAGVLDCGPGAYVEVWPR